MGDRTIYQVLEDSAKTYGDAAALHQPGLIEGKKGYRSYSWHDYLQIVREIAAGLRSLGIERGDIVALDSETRAEFYFADLGIVTNGSIAAALYSNYPPADLLKTIAGCDARLLFVEDPKTFKALHSAKVEHFVLLTGEAEGAMTLDALRQRGREWMAANPEAWDEALRQVQPSDDALLYLTSGATGEPKMVMVSHKAVTANLEMGPHVLPIGPEDRTVAWLPSAHIAQRIVIELLPIRCGMPVWFAESLTKLPHDIRSVKPTIFLAPPRMWERVYSTVAAEIQKKPAIIRRLLYGALGMASEAAKRRREGKGVPATWSLPLKLADRVLFSKVRERFGGQMRVAASGAAPLSKELAGFYEAIGMPLVEGYGLTEGGVAALNPVDGPIPGSIGKALPGVEFRIADDGEIVLQSPCLFSRYYKDPAATAEVLRDGCLHTGDVGHIDEKGFIYITGRKKELIVSSTGKKVFPSRVESLFKVEPLISNIFLVGDRLPFVSALVTINPGIAETLPGMNGETPSLPHLAESKPVHSEVQQIIKRVNKQLAPFEQIRKFRILTRDFSLEQGELTATMKVRRKKVIDNFKSEIDQLYAGSEKSDMG